MARFYEFDSTKDGIPALTNQLMFSSRAEADLVTSVDIHYHNVLASFASFDWEFDLKRYWLPRSRWNKLVHQYVDLSQLGEWLDKTEVLTGKNRGVSVMKLKDVPTRYGKVTARRWGACMLSVSYRAVPEPTIVLHSRTSYLGYLTPLDITVAHVCARMIGERVGVTPEEMRFDWFCEIMQYHHSRCQGYAFGDPEMRTFILTSSKVTREDAYGAWGSKQWWRKIKGWDDENQLYEDMTFMQNRRMRKRLHIEAQGLEYSQQFASDEKGCGVFTPLPSVSSNDLNFDMLYR